MDVNKQNFNEKFELFDQQMNDPNLCFISMDCEMTGISHHGDSFLSQNNYQDSLEQRYAKMVHIFFNIKIKSLLCFDIYVYIYCIFMFCS